MYICTYVYIYTYIYIYVYIYTYIYIYLGVSGKIPHIGCCLPQLQGLLADSIVSGHLPATSMGFIQIPFELMKMTLLGGA